MEKKKESKKNEKETGNSSGPGNPVVTQQPSSDGSLPRTNSEGEPDKRYDEVKKKKQKNR